MSQIGAAAPVSIDQVNQHISGKRVGHFLNRQNTRYPVTYNFMGKGRKITGTAYIPNSSYDEHPTLKGTYAAKGNSKKIKIKTSTDFTLKAKITLSSNGSYWLKGSVSGPNTGKLELQKQ